MKHVRYNFAELNAIPFSSVVERLGEVKRSGSTLTTICPWHDDHHPSLTIYDKDKGNRCKCFACGKGGSVIDYVMAKRNVTFNDACEWLSREFNTGAEEWDDTNPHVPQREQRKKTGDEILKEEAARRNQRKVKFDPCIIANENVETVFAEDYLAQFVSSDNSFSKCLREYFDKDTVERMTIGYQLGCFNQLGMEDDVLFPSMDRKMRIRNIKVQHYDCNPQSPNFFHCDRDHIYWLGDILKKRGEVPQEAKLSSTVLFGEHLLGIFPNQKVALVESPKNAIVAACVFPEYIWLATGNKNNLTRSSLEPLRNRQVLVIPDNDALDDWRREIGKLDGIADFSFSPVCDNELKKLGAKADIADWIIANTSKPHT